MSDMDTVLSKMVVFLTLEVGGGRCNISKSSHRIFRYSRGLSDGGFKLQPERQVCNRLKRREGADTPSTAETVCPTLNQTAAVITATTETN
jgi:hypothetical protein